MTDHLIELVKSIAFAGVAPAAPYLERPGYREADGQIGHTRTQAVKDFGEFIAAEWSTTDGIYFFLNEDLPACPGCEEPIIPGQASDRADDDETVHCDCAGAYNEECAAPSYADEHRLCGAQLGVGGRG